MKQFWIEGILIILMLTILVPIEGDGSGETQIGTAVFVQRTFDQFVSTRTGQLTKFSRKTTPGSSQITNKPSNDINGPTRDLQSALGCRDDSNDIASIVECTNAVRQNPDLFENDFPCKYSDWRNEVANKNLVMLSTEPLIQRVAQLHTDDQAKMNSMSHTGSDGSDLQTRADRINMPWGAIGENVAVGFSNAKAVVMAWMCSPPHRKNVMSCDFAKIGIGAAVSSSGRNYYTQVFSCGLNEKCGCKSGPSPSQTASAPKPRPTAAPDGGDEPGHGAASSTNQRCDWVNGVWTCGQNVPEHGSAGRSDEYSNYY